MPLESTTHGLLARAGDYEPLRAFSQGGFYWDRVPQQLIREGGLAEFLPPVEVEKDDRGKYGRFHREEGGRELLTRSKPLGGRRIPPDQLRRLNHAIADLNQKAQEPGAQPQNRELIETAVKIAKQHISDSIPCFSSAKPGFQDCRSYFIQF